MVALFFFGGGGFGLFVDFPFLVAVIVINTKACPLLFLVLPCLQYYAAIVTTDGDLYMVGNNSYGQLGQGDTVERREPSLVDRLQGQRVEMVSCANYSLAILCEGGRMYTMGEGGSGQLGHGNTVDYHEPAFVPLDEEVVHVAMGSFAGACATVSGKLYTWGTMYDSGHPDSNVPRQVEMPDGALASKVYTNGSHMVFIVSTVGRVYALGLNENSLFGAGGVWVLD